ncbi:NAD(P)-binding domain-containing protein [Nocardiopsis alba]|uniref:NAD(P)-binding domain-containing protein n=1 Tax=Nocardiopsis alba TaxID=53437 RepID=A0A7K2IS08_9ACTN|nr:NAD(P)-binding domain-containing protein [Nocardiopsis alba]MYR32721.1 NAD(P)-binding domain-containing protein [Nocardiopsis alba]
MSDRKVTVVGLGPMGRAMVRAYLSAGYTVTVWNRTPEKAGDLVREGALRAGTLEEAFGAGGPVVMSLTDYDAVDAILDRVPDAALAGSTIVDLTSDTPERARRTTERMSAKGATHLVGGVQVPPPLIGTPDAVSYYSGSKAALEEHRAALEVLTGLDHLGEDPGLAPLYYQIGVSMFWSGLLGYVQGQALAQANGIGAEEFLPRALKNMDFGYFLRFYAARIDAGEHGGDVDTLTMGRASLEHVLHTGESSGVDGLLTRALIDLVGRGIAEGHGGDSLTSLIGVLRTHRSE